MLTDLIELLLMFAVQVSAVRLLQNSVLARPDEWLSPKQQWIRATRNTLGLYAVYVAYVLLVLPLFLRWAQSVGWVAFVLAALGWLALVFVPVLVFRRVYRVGWLRALRAAIIWSGVAGALTPLIFGVTRFLVGMTVERPAIMLPGYAAAAALWAGAWVLRRRQASRFAEVATGEREVKERTARISAPAEERLDIPLPDDRERAPTERIPLRPKLTLGIAILTAGLGVVATLALPGDLLRPESTELSEVHLVEDVDEYATLAQLIPQEEGWYPLDDGREGSWHGRDILVTTHTPILRVGHSAWQILGLLGVFAALGIGLVVRFRRTLGRDLIVGVGLGALVLLVYAVLATGAGTPWGNAELWLMASGSGYLQTSPLPLWMTVLTAGVLLAWVPQLVISHGYTWRAVALAACAGVVLLTVLFALGEAMPIFAFCPPHEMTPGACRDAMMAARYGVGSTSWLELATSPADLHGPPLRGTFMVHRWYFGLINWGLLLTIGVATAWRAKFRGIRTAMIAVATALGGAMLVSTVFLGLSDGGATSRFFQMELVVMLISLAVGALGVAAGYRLRGGRSRFSEWDDVIET